MFKEGRNYSELFREACEIEAAHGDGNSNCVDAQKSIPTALKKYVFSKYGGARDRVIMKKTQMVHPYDEEEDESKMEAVEEVAETSEVAEPAEVGECPQRGYPGKH